MDRKTLGLWLPIGVAIALLLLTTSGNAWVLGGTLAAMLIAAPSYNRCRRFLLAAIMAMLVSAAITGAAIRLRLRNQF